MAKLRVLSGDEVIAIFARYGFAIDSQRGSHVKMVRRRSDGTRQSLTISRHRDVDRGTLLAIYRQALRYFSEPELRPYFYTS
jgi:predicted RNA binding protein YcfA (HicA-like mRNA interferase family)